MSSNPPPGQGWQGLENLAHDVVEKLANPDLTIDQRFHIVLNALKQAQAACRRQPWDGITIQGDK